MAVIGYAKAKALMKHEGWYMHVTMKRNILQHAELLHPEQQEYHTVRRDSAEKLIPECAVHARITDETASLCYDHEGCNTD